MRFALDALGICRQLATRPARRCSARGGGAVARMKRSSAATIAAASSGEADGAISWRCGAATHWHRDAPYSGMFPCLRFGPASRLLCSVRSAMISFGRVSCGTITSSM